MSRDGCVLSGVQHAPSKRDAYGDVGVKFISREGNQSIIASFRYWNNSL